MATTRLFSRSRPLFAPTALVPSCSTPNLNTCASSASPECYSFLDFISIRREKMKELRARKVEFLMDCNENMWNKWREDSEIRAKKDGSPFAILADHISTNKTSYNPKMEKLGEHLRGWRDINCSTKIDKILMDKRLEKFQSSMTADEIRNYVMRHLYILTLQEVIPMERRYMEKLIKEDDHFVVVDQWPNCNFDTLVKSYSERFWMLPRRCLRRGLELHMSRIPYDYCLRKKLPKVLKKDMLGKLEEEYVILVSKVHELPTISEEMMASETKSFVDHVDAACSLNRANESLFHSWLNKPWM